MACASPCILIVSLIVTFLSVTSTAYISCVMEHYNCHKLVVIGDASDFQVFVKLYLLHCVTREAHICLPIRGGIVAVFPAELDRILIDSGILQ